MKLDVWLEVISHSGLEIDLETLSRGLDVRAEAWAREALARAWE